MKVPLPTPVAPSRGDPARLSVPGAFDWWYLDLLDGAGNGAVVIGSFGLPMIPLSLPDRRATPPHALPALALSVYEAGRPAHWVFRTFRPDEASWDGERRRFGDHELTLSLADGRARFEATLRGRSARAAFEGTIAAEGPLRRAAPGEPTAADHEWCLLSAGAAGSVDLRVEGRPLRFEGTAYLDRNAGVAPLSDLGVTRWSWARLSFRAGTLVWYETPEESRVWWSAADGEVSAVPGAPRAVGRRLGRYLLRHPAAMSVPTPGRALEVALDHVVEDGPFYRRFAVRAADPDLGEGVGYAEWAAQGAMDRSPLLPLVRMAVDAGEGSSMWLPLLSGPPASRWRRFLGVAA